MTFAVMAKGTVPMTDLESDLLFANARIEKLKKEKAVLLKALEFFSGCRSCKHLKDMWNCELGGCNGNSKESKWEYRGL